MISFLFLFSATWIDCILPQNYKCGSNWDGRRSDYYCVACSIDKCNSEEGCFVTGSSPYEDCVEAMNIKCSQTNCAACDNNPEECEAKSCEWTNYPKACKWVPVCDTGYCSLCSASDGSNCNSTAGCSWSGTSCSSTGHSCSSSYCSSCGSSSCNSTTGCYWNLGYCQATTDSSCGSNSCSSCKSSSECSSKYSCSFDGGSCISSSQNGDDDDSGSDGLNLFGLFMVPQYFLYIIIGGSVFIFLLIVACAVCCCFCCCCRCCRKKTSPADKSSTQMVSMAQQVQPLQTQQTGYPQPGAYGYPQQTGYGYPQQGGYGYPPQQGGYGYPPQEGGPQQGPYLAQPVIPAPQQEQEQEQTQAPSDVAAQTQAMTERDEMGKPPSLEGMTSPSAEGAPDASGTQEKDQGQGQDEEQEQEEMTKEVEGEE